MEKEISQAVIRRMPRYYRYLGELLDEGVERISSSDLSRRMNVTASQIRQDLNNFGGFGQQGSDPRCAAPGHPGLPGPLHGLYDRGDQG